MGKKWDTESDFDNQADQSGVAHESVANTDHQDGGEITMGYQYNDAQSLHSILSSLVGWWPLHTQSGDVVDLSGQGDAGSRSGTISGVSGKGGLMAHSFDGADDYIKVPNSSSGSSKDFTVVAWCRPSSFPNTSNYIFSREGTNSGIILRCDSSGVPYGYVNDGAYQSVSGTAMPTDEWQMLAFTCANNTEIELYQDTTKQATTAIGDINLDTSNSEVQIGARQVAGSDPYERFWSGVLCNVMYFDKALSSSEIQTLYDWHHEDYAEPPDNDNGGVSYWKLDEDSGSTAVDSWGSNNGSIIGATVGVGGVRDTSYSFDGVDDLVDVAISQNSSEFSFSYWARSNSPTTNNEGVISFQTGSGDLFTVNQRGDLSGDPYGIVLKVDGTFYDGKSSDNTPPTGEWRHEVVTYRDGGDAVLYRNGVEISSMSVSGVMDDMSSVNIGTNNSEKSMFDGRIDDVRLYDRVLNPWEVHELYQYGTRGRDMRDLTVIA